MTVLHPVTDSVIRICDDQMLCLLFTLRCVYKYRRPTQRGVHRKRHYRRAAYSVRVHGVPGRPAAAGGRGESQSPRSAGSDSIPMSVATVQRATCLPGTGGGGGRQVLFCVARRPTRTLSRLLPGSDCFEPRPAQFVFLP